MQTRRGISAYVDIVSTYNSDLLLVEYFLKRNFAMKRHTTTVNVTTRSTHRVLNSGTVVLSDCDAKPFGSIHRELL